MCGLAGLARIDGGVLDASADRVLSRMAGLVAHRGPDEQVVLRDGPVGLAFTRLSLVDPAGGGQPLTTEDGSVVLIANGEVYNHRELAATLPSGVTLRTRSDCEILVHLYREHGTRFLDRVRGMFALILWDRARKRLVLARDRFGIKPLYFFRNSRQVVLGSEIKALFANPSTPRRVDWEAALTNPFLAAAPCFTGAAPSSWFEGVEQVPPGSILDIDLRTGQTRQHRYWRFPGPGRELPPSDAEVVHEYGELLAASVVECATADAEVGLFLSGGVDSSAVAALAAPSARLHTFTVLNGGTYRNGDAEHAHTVAARLGLPNHQVVFDAGRVPSPDDWRRLVWLTETPQCGPEVYYKHELHRYARTARPGIKAMLLGAASDEFNGGYSVDLSGTGEWTGFLANLSAMGRRGHLRRRPDLAPWWELSQQPLVSDEVIARFAAGQAGDPYRAYLDWEYRKIQQYNCWHEDRTAAGSGIEARVPFLDHRLVELVAAVPPTRRRKLLWDKRILRDAMRDLLPPEIVERPKVPFFYGDGLAHTYRIFARMLAQDGDALVEQALAAPRAAELLDPAAVRSTVRALAADPLSAPLELLLQIVNLGLLEQMAEAVPGPLAAMPVGPPPRRMDVTDWAAARAGVERAVLGSAEPDPGQIPRLADGVLLLTSPADPRTWYVLVDGAIAYVIDDEGSLEWLEFLRGVDGRRSVGEILAGTGSRLPAVAPLLRQSVDIGLLQLAGA